MKRCSRCLQYFEDQNDTEESPVEELADMFLLSTGEANPEDLYPECKEELGMITTLGFGD